MKLVGLTGGIGSGKSTVADYLRQAGFSVIEADKIGHDLLAHDAEIQRAVLSAFGPEIVVSGTISRDKLAQQVFYDAEARQQLNHILHPAIIKTIAEECRRISDLGHKVVIVEAAILCEGGKREEWLEGLILVLADSTKRVDRLVKNRQMTEHEAWQRITSQIPPETKMAFADWIIYNEGDMDSLKAQTLNVVNDLLALY